MTYFPAQLCSTLGVKRSSETEKRNHRKTENQRRIPETPVRVIMERFVLCSSSSWRRYTKEKTFSIIDEKLKPIRAKFQKDQQMDMDEFHMIFTRSNELIHVVDCRSQEEYDECHISGSYTLVVVSVFCED